MELNEKSEVRITIKKHFERDEAMFFSDNKEILLKQSVILTP